MSHAERNCLRCGKQLEVGYLLDVGEDVGEVGHRREARWVEGPPERSFWKGLKLKKRKVLPVQADRCPQCGTIDLRAE